MEMPTISVLVACYNNQKYLYECLRSIFSQTYPRIEVLIGDDCSAEFDGQALIGWINANRTPNIVKIAAIHNETNIGTVANFERLQSRSSGEYLFNIAADDVLYDENVLENLYECALENGEDTEIIVADTEMWDHDLHAVIGTFMQPEAVELIKTASPHDLFAACADHIILPASYLYKRTIIEKVGPLSDRYVLVEDWPLHLRLLAQGVKPLYMDKSPAIKHRDGGISHGNSQQAKKAYLQYYNDIINLYPNEIEPHLDLLSEEEKNKIQSLYDKRVRAYCKIHIPAYYKECAGNGKEEKSVQKSKEKPGTRKLVGQAVYKLSRKWMVLGAAAAALLCFIAAGCVTLVGVAFAELIGKLLLISGCVMGLFGLSAAAVNVLLRIYHRIHGR